MPDQTRSLHERGAETDALLAAARRASEGRGSLALVSGTPGIGKSTLLDAVAVGADGLGTFRATGHELEATIPYGVVRQLFGRAYAATAVREGASGLAAGIFSPTEPWAAAESGTVLHGLYWFVDELARDRPLVLLVDDVQWCDEASLLALGYVARRLEDLPVLLVLAARAEAVASPPTPALAALLDEAQLRVEPGELSPAAVASVLTELLAAEPADEFVAACHAATGGNPFLLRALAAEVRDQSLPPTADTARAVGALAPGEVSVAVRSRLHRLAPATRTVAEALAILGDGASVVEVADLSGTNAETVAQAAVDLRRAGLVSGDAGALAYVHALVRTTVLAGIDPLVLPGVRRRAAATLRAHQRSDVEVAAHLTEVTGLDEEDLKTLRSAAEATRDAGAPQGAVPLLRHVLDELESRNAPDTELAEAVLALGDAEAAAGDPAAVPDLERAVSLVTTSESRAAAVLALARAQKFAGAPVDAATMLAGTLQRGEAAEDLQGELEMELLGLVASSAACRALLAPQLHALVAAPPVGAPVTERDHMVRAVLAFEAGFTGREHVVARDEARAAVAGWALPTDPARGGGFGILMAAVTLMWCDELDEADGLYTRIIDDARRNGTPVGLSTALGLRALVRRRSGALASADADAAEAIRLADELDVTPPLLPAAVAMAALVGFERDADPAVLRQVLARPTDPDGAPSGLLFHARGRVLAGLGDLEGGLQQVLEAGRFDESIGIRNPAVLEWRSDAARMLAALGDTHRGRDLAQVELERARAFGTARATGLALSALAATHAAEQQIALLQESVETLAGSPDRLEEARSRIELGAALRRARRISEARVELNAGLDGAHRCGATRLTAHALDELRAAGAKPRRTAVSGVEALTASERRVAELAATGSTNRTIAQQLFVSEKTVETHLSHAYDKLGVRSRAALPQLLASA